LPAQANTQCPDSLDPFTSPPLTADCTITADTVWGNGTLTLAGNLNVNAGVSLTLWNMIVQLSPSSDLQYRIYLAGGQLVVRGGTLTSTSANFRWHLETNSDSGVLVDIDRTNVSYAGSGSTSGFVLFAGNGHRFRRLTVTSSPLGSQSGVVDVNGLGIGDVRVENSTFSNTGTAFYVHAVAGGANLVFRDNAITNFASAGGTPAIFAKSTQILDNSMSLGSAPGVTLWGGGPGWPSKNAYNVSGNTITTTGQAITTSNSLGYDVTWNRIVGGHVTFDGTGNRFAYNNVTGVDERTSPGHAVWTSAISSFDHNTLWNVGLTRDSGFVVTNYGNVKVTDNRLYLGCYGNNCMGIEVINVQASQQPIYPGFPTVEVARNRITWMAIAPGGLTIFLDNEYSEREYLHNNTEAVLPGAGTPTSSLQGGGVSDSVYENNTVLGPTTYCIYEYINSAANNLFQYNRCNRGQYGGIFQTGGNVYRSNVFTNLTGLGIFICPNAFCAGAETTNTSNNAWYNNTFTFATNPAYLTRMSLGNAFYNTFLGHGAGQWTDGSNQHSVPGDWLFFSNAPIAHLAFSDAPNGHRTLTVEAGGRTYWDTESLAGIADAASLAVDGAIDYHGSVNGGTVLWSLNPRGTTALDVTGTGPTTFTFHGYVPSSTYNVTTQSLGTGAYGKATLTMDQNGTGQFELDFGPGSHYVLTISGSFPFPGDTTPPAQVADLRASVVAPHYVVLQWTAPGNNGSVGQASEYDLRFSTSGPLDNATFGMATRVPTLAPELAGSTESFNVSGLLPETPYWFALRTADAVPNWSPISNDVSVTTPALPPPVPAVSSASVDLSRFVMQVTFTQQMNRSSVNASLQIAPAVAYHVVWADDTILLVVFDGILQNGTEYKVTIAPTATSQRGQSLASSFVYRFTVPASGTTGPPPPAAPPPPIAPPPFPWVLLAAAVILSASLVALVYVRYRAPPGWGTNWRLRLRRRLPGWMRWKWAPKGTAWRLRLRRRLPQWLRWKRAPKGPA
jgi:hypothetical protein